MVFETTFAKRACLQGVCEGAGLAGNLCCKLHYLDGEIGGKGAGTAGGGYQGLFHKLLRGKTELL